MKSSTNAPVTNEPASKTQIEIVRAHLMTGATITTWDAYSLYQITCLAQRIYDLRNLGLNIKSEMTTQNGKSFKLYWIDNQAINISKEVSNEPA